MANKNNGKAVISDKEITLSPELFVGHGLHKECYRYPGNPGLCIKVAYNEEGISDLVREIGYFKSLSHKNLDYSVLPAYYGPVKTDKGEGHVFEFITDYDGSLCLTVEDILKDAALSEKHFDFLVKDLKKLHRNLLDNRIITMGLFPENIIIQYTAPDKRRLRVVNDVGCGTFIPLSYYFDVVARNHIEKRWQRFTQHLADQHRAGLFPSPLVPELADRIRRVSEKNN